MPRLNLTQLAAERLRAPAGKAVIHWDIAVPGFGLRVSPKGRKTWVAQYRVKGGREIVETIGTMSVIPSLGEARNRARASMVLAKQGIDPVMQRQQHESAAQAEKQATGFTFAVLSERYLTEYARVHTRKRTSDETARLLKRAASFFADKPVQMIRKGDVLELLAERRANKFGTEGLSELTNMLVVVRRAFRWAVRQDLVVADPTADVDKPAKHQERDRVLSDDEIIAFWHGCEQLGWPFGPVFQLLLLTSQRLKEVGGMRWSELDLANRVWHLPAAVARNQPSRTKNGKAHDVHLSAQAMAIIDGLHHLTPQPGKPDFVFSISGDAAVSSFASAKARVARYMGVTDWRLHDVRRTATTIMARLGVAPHVADKVLNHTSGTIKGVAAVYNRFEYLPERKAALDKLGRFIEGLVHPATKVVALRA